MIGYYSCIGICLVGLLPIKDRNKYRVITCFVLAVIVLVMANANENMVDLRNYSITYNRIAIGTPPSYADYGYYLLQYVISRFGVTFHGFRILIFVLGLTLQLATVKKYTNCISFFFLYYMLFYAVMDAEQLRNFVSYSIVIYAIPLLVENTKTNKIKYTVYIFLASQFHFMAISYLIFLLVFRVEKFDRLFRVLIPLYLLIMYYLSRNSVIIQNIIKFVSIFGNEKVSLKLSVYSQTLSNWGFLLPCMIYLLSLLFIYYFQTIDVENHIMIHSLSTVGGRIGAFCHSVDLVPFNKLCVLINIIGTLFIPLCMINLTFYRIIRNITVFNLTYFASRYEASGNANNIKYRYYITFVCFVLIIFWQFWDFTIYQEWDTMRQFFFIR